MSYEYCLGWAEPLLDYLALDLPLFLTRLIFDLVIQPFWTHWPRWCELYLRGTP